MLTVVGAFAPAHAQQKKPHLIEGALYTDWYGRHRAGAEQYVGQFLGTFRQFPPSQKPGSFSIDNALHALQQSSGD